MTTVATGLKMMLLGNEGERTAIKRDSAELYCVACQATRSANESQAASDKNDLRADLKALLGAVPLPVRQVTYTTHEKERTTSW